MYRSAYSGNLRSLCRWTVLAGLGLMAAAAQTQDTTGNGMLKGTFHFRDVAIQSVDENFNPTEVTASYGTITFDGAGNYTIVGSTVDNTISGGAIQPLNVTATYAIGANGAGYLVNPIFPTDPDAFVYGAVSQGVFTGSATESQGDGNVFNDLFIAIPGGTTPTNASFTSPYQTGLLDFANGGSSAIKNALFELSPNGSGVFSTIALNGQASNLNATTVNQSIPGATYNFNSDGSATLTIPLPTGVSATNALFTGAKTIFQSADGNFILGWTSTGYDIFFGVKALTVTGTNALSGGLYFTAAVEDNLASGFGTDSYYGSTKNFGDANGDGIVHQRVNAPEEFSFDFGTDDQIEVNSDGSAPQDFNGYQYLFGDGANAFVAIGTDGFFSLQVGTRAPAFPYSGSGVYINPVGVVNAASDQPITASLAPGELITLYGNNFISGSASAPPGSFPTNVGGVTATIDGIACPIFYVLPGQMSLIVPYEVATNTTGLANIQVNNNGTLSNVVQMYLTDSAPGSFSQNVEGIGLAAAVHATGNFVGQEITDNSPAQPGEYISLFVTGLGLVSPTIPDGAAGPSNPLSYSDLYQAGNLSVFFNDFAAGSTGNQGTIQYAGLAPYYVGLYQINVQVPSTGLTSGDFVYVEFTTDAADVDQIQIPYGSGTFTNSAAALKKRAIAARTEAIRARRTNATSHSLRKPPLQ